MSYRTDKWNRGGALTWTELGFPALVFPSIENGPTENKMSARHIAMLAASLFSFIAGGASAQHIVPSALLTIDQNRATVVDRIVNQWGDPGLAVERRAVGASAARDPRGIAGRSSAGGTRLTLLSRGRPRER